MLLNPAQQDAISELINIGFGRAASALSTLVGKRVLLGAPQVDLSPVQELNAVLSNLGNGDIITVHQVFGGKLVGDAMLLMDASNAVTLVDLLMGSMGGTRKVNLSDQETLSEVGNILLNALIGSFGNLLRVHIVFSAPRLRLEPVQTLLRKLQSENPEAGLALVVRINFSLAQAEVEGYVIIVMGAETMNILFESMQAEGFLEH